MYVYIYIYRSRSGDRESNILIDGGRCDTPCSAPIHAARSCETIFQFLSSTSPVTNETRGLNLSTRSLDIWCGPSASRTGRYLTQPVKTQRSIDYSESLEILRALGRVPLMAGRTMIHAVPSFHPVRCVFSAFAALFRLLLPKLHRRNLFFVNSTPVSFMYVTILLCCYEFRFNKIYLANNK